MGDGEGGRGGGRRQRKGWEGGGPKTAERVKWGLLERGVRLCERGRGTWEETKGGGVSGQREHRKAQPLAQRKSGCLKGEGVPGVAGHTPWTRARRDPRVVFP